MTQRSPIPWIAAIVLATASPALAADGAARDPVVAALWMGLQVLLLAGLVFATVASFKLPGTGITEVIAVTLLAALLVPAVMAGTAQWYEIVAIIGGIALLAIEVFLLPGLGTTGVIGALLVFGGLAMIFVPDPRGIVPLDLGHFRNALLLMIGGIIGGGTALAILGRYLPHVPRADRLILRETNTTPLPDSSGPTVGDVGVVLTDLRPGGTARFAIEGDASGYREMSVVCDRGFVAAGAQVVIADIEGSKVIVRPASTGGTA